MANVQYSMIKGQVDRNLNFFVGHDLLVNTKTA